MNTTPQQLTDGMDDNSTMCLAKEHACALWNTYSRADTCERHVKHRWETGCSERNYESWRGKWRRDSARRGRWVERAVRASRQAWVCLESPVWSSLLSQTVPHHLQLFSHTPGPFKNQLQEREWDSISTTIKTEVLHYDDVLHTVGYTSPCDGDGSQLLFIMWGK